MVNANRLQQETKVVRFCLILLPNLWEQFKPRPILSFFSNFRFLTACSLLSVNGLNLTTSFSSSIEFKIVTVCIFICMINSNAVANPGTICVARIFDWGGPNPQKFGCLHRNWEWFFSRNRKFERFFRPKSGDLQKKKKRSSPKLRVIFQPKSEIRTIFSPKIRWSPKKKKKGLHRNWERFFGRNR